MHPEGGGRDKTVFHVFPTLQWQIAVLGFREAEVIIKQV